MRVLLLDQYSDRGGGQRMLLQTLCAIRARGWNALVALPGRGPMFEEVRGLGFRTAVVDCGPFRSGKKSAADSLRFFIQLPRLANRIGQLTAEFAPQVLYINGPRLLPAAARARITTPVLFHAHTGLAGIQQRLAGTALRRLHSSVVAVSESVASCWRPFAPTGIVHNAVSGPVCPRTCRPEGPPRIGCIGRISPEKGQREFLRVARRILETIPGARFFIYGAPLFGDRSAAAYAEQVRNAAKDLPVEFPGWVDDVYAAFANLDLLLVPSVWEEPNALVILEAFAAAVPVIAFRAGGIPEFLDQLAETPEEMAALAVEVLADPARHVALASAGIEAWRTRFHPSRYNREITEAIESCASVASAI